MSIEALQIVLYHVTPKKLHQFNWRKLSETSPFRALCQLLYIGKLLHVTASLQLCCRALHHEVCTRLASAVAILRAGNLQLLRVAARPFFTESSSFPPLQRPVLPETRLGVGLWVPLGEYGIPRSGERAW